MTGNSWVTLHNPKYKGRQNRGLNLERLDREERYYVVCYDRRRRISSHNQEFDRIPIFNVVFEKVQL